MPVSEKLRRHQEENGCGYGLFKDPSRPVPKIYAADGTWRYLGESKMRGAKSVPAEMCDINLVEVVPCRSQGDADDVMMGRREDADLEQIWPTSRDSLNIEQREDRGYDPVEAIRHKRAQDRLCDAGIAGADEAGRN